MARLARVEDRPTPPEVYSWRVYVNALIATFAAIMIGLVFVPFSLEALNLTFFL